MVHGGGWGAVVTQSTDGTFNQLDFWPTLGVTSTFILDRVSVLLPMYCSAMSWWPQ